MNDLAWQLATRPEASLRNGAEAVELARRAEQLTGAGKRRCSIPWPPPTPRRGGFPRPWPRPAGGWNWPTRQDKKTLANTLRNRIALYEAKRAFQPAMNCCARSRRKHNGEETAQR